MQFFLDENLPPQVARALALVGYPITHPDEHGKRGEKDPDLIVWLAQTSSYGSRKTMTREKGMLDRLDKQLSRSFGFADLQAERTPSPSSRCT